jgi:uncharacterized protein (TIRG00374 family)
MSVEQPVPAARPVEDANPPDPPPTDASTSTADAATAAGGVLVVEPPMPHRVRRPRDLLRGVLGVAVICLSVFVGSIAVGTATGLEQDLVGVADGLPRLLLRIVTFVASVGVLALPIFAAIDLVLRHRAGQILDSIVGAAISVTVTTSLTFWITNERPAQILEALTKVLPDGSRSRPLDNVLAAVVAFLVVADIAGRTRLRVACGLTVGAVFLSTVLSGEVTLLSIVVSLLLGGTIGMFVRWAFGSFSTRPDGHRLAAAMSAGGLEVTALVREDDGPDNARHYLATDAAGNAYDVVVLDRDKEGANLVTTAWRKLRIIGPVVRTRALAVRTALEHDALASYAMMAAGVSTPRLALTSEADSDAGLLAYERPAGRPLGEFDADGISDATLADLWAQHARMLQARIAHRGLTRDRILVNEDGTVVLVDLRYAVVAANDLQLRLDTAELLVTLTLAVGSERAVASGIAALGADEIADALPLLQPLALAPTTRRAVRQAKGLLHDLRDRVIDATPSPPTEPAQLQRLSLRTTVSIVGLTIAAYFLLTTLGNINLGSLVSTVNWGWATVAMILSILTYVGATLSFIGFVPEPLKFVRTFVAQLAASFVNLLAPSQLGGAALNARYLERSGIEPALAVATVGVSQVAAFIIHISMLILFGVLAGSARDTSFTPPQDAVIITVFVFAAAAVFLLLPIGRRVLQERVRPMFGRVIPRLISVLQQPKRVATGFGGNLLLNLSYIFCLVASVRAFGGELSIVAIGVVYLAGSAVGNAVPTPGGLGAVEAALAAGLTAAGLEANVAVSAVLLFRLVTFWIPVLPGWLSFHWLQRRGLL